VKALRALVLAGPIKAKTPYLDLIKRLQKDTAALSRLLQKPSAPLNEIFAAHVKAATDLSKAGNHEPLWQGPGGAALAAFISKLRDEGESLGRIPGHDYPGLLRALLEGEVVRRPFGSHPRLSILGALEARMQAPDLIILGSLNEGSWPPAGKADPWMSQEMRKELGLPTPEQRIGQSAHDFLMALGANEDLVEAICLAHDLGP